MQKGIKLGLAVVMVALVLGLGATGCPAEKTTTPTTTAPTTAPTTTAPTTTEPEVFELDFAIMMPMADPVVSVAYVGWINYLETASDGRLKINFYPDQQAGAASEHYDMVLNQVVDFGGMLDSSAPGRWPLHEVISLPFIFEPPASWCAVKTMRALYEKYPELQAEHSDVKVLGFHQCALALYHFSSETQVKTVDDLQGMVLQMYNSGERCMFSKLGVSLEMLATGAEQYDALQKGVIDGTSAPYCCVQFYKLDEVTSSTLELGIALDQWTIIMNWDVWNSLPPDLQALFEESGQTFSELAGYQFDLGESVARELREEYLSSAGLPPIYVPTEADKAPFLEAGKECQEEWVSKMEAQGLPGRAILEDALMFAEQYRYENTPFEECAQTLKDWGAPEWSGF